LQLVNSYVSTRTCWVVARSSRRNYRIPISSTWHDQNLQSATSSSEFCLKTRYSIRHNINKSIDMVNYAHTYRHTSWTRTRVAIPCNRRTWKGTCPCTRSWSSTSSRVYRGWIRGTPTETPHTDSSFGPQHTSVRKLRAGTCRTRTT